MLRIFKCQGGASMSPFIKKGDILIVKTDSKNLIPGDIIVFKYQDQILAHRILFKIGKSYLVKGDTNFFPESISKNDILGKVVIVYRAKNTKIKYLPYFNIFVLFFSFIYPFLYRVLRMFKNI